MIVVSNTTPLIGLASIERFQLLKQLFGEIRIPQAVYDETVVAGREEGGAKREVQAATWISTLPVKDRLAVDVLLGELDLGEAETIVLAREIGADWVLMDEKKGRRKLAQLSMPKVGTLMLRKRDIVELLHQVDIRDGTSFSSSRWRSRHEVFATGRKWWSFSELIGHYLDVRNAVAAHANPKPPFRLSVNQAREIQELVADMLYIAVFKKDLENTK